MPIAADRAGAADARNVELELVSHIPRALGWIPTSFGVDAREEKIKVRRGRLGGGISSPRRTGAISANRATSKCAESGRRRRAKLSRTHGLKCMIENTVALGSHA
jgi:hypothetical protein